MFVNGLVFVFLTFLTFFDIKSKQLPVRLIALFGLAIVGICLVKGSFGSWEILVRVLPGMFLIIVAYLSNQSIGYGDGIVVLLIGLLIDIQTMMSFVLLAFLLSAVASVLLLIVRRGNRQSKIPFMPFLLMAWCVCLAWI